MSIKILVLNFERIKVNISKVIEKKNLSNLCHYFWPAPSHKYPSVRRYHDQNRPEVNFDISKSEWSDQLGCWTLQPTVNLAAIKATGFRRYRSRAIVKSAVLWEGSNGVAVQADGGVTLATTTYKLAPCR